MWYNVVEDSSALAQLGEFGEELAMMKKLFVIMLGVMIVLFAIGGVCVTTETYQITYEVTGTALAASLTFTNEDGGTSQESDVWLPWTYSFEAEEGDWVSILAQNTGDTGSVTVTIYRDGEVFRTSTSSGAYVIATASDFL